MKVFLSILVMIAVYGILFVLAVIIPGIIEKRRQNIREKVAREVLNGIDLSGEKERIMNLNKSLNFVVDTQKCPLCGGALIMNRHIAHRTNKQTIYGGYLTCVDFPNCTFAIRTY